MKILFVTPEMAPFLKTGGLGDVAGALPQTFAALGHDVKTFMPWYGVLDEYAYPIRTVDWSATVPVGKKNVSISVGTAFGLHSSLKHFFIDNEHYFERSAPYLDPSTGKDYPDNDERFIFFTRAVLETVKHLDWQPDIIHVHDWQSGLIPAYLKTVYADDPFFARTKTVLTIHNLAYQGVFEKERFANLNLPDELFLPTAPFEFYGKVNFLKAAIAFADKITTVSPTYAHEIQTEELGCGLHGVLRNRADDLVGILNGVDYSIWSPSRDTHIPFRYHINNLSGKRMNKVELLGKAGLPIREKVPLFGVISRLVDQKGFDLLQEIADDFFAENLQMVLLGTGEKTYHQFFIELEKHYPDKLRVYLTFDESLAHFIEAGADVFLMPSRFEPCGLNQMYSLKYGTVPLVRKVGGLADTVIDYDVETGEGTGFVFEEYSPEALLTTVKRAVNLYPKRRAWTKLMKAGMRQDFSWERSARKYLQLFEALTGA